MRCKEQQSLSCIFFEGKTMNIVRFFCISCICFFASSKAFCVEQKDLPFVTAKIYGQLGNNLFQVAVASAVAWSNNAVPCFPEISSNSPLFQHVFFRCANRALSRPITCVHAEVQEFRYHPIPFHNDMGIHGYFQTDKYFASYREQILKLFAPHPNDLAYIEKKYAHILNNTHTVGVQLRYYKWEFPTDDLFPQYGKEYLDTAMRLFPPSSLFVVSSNNLEFARKNIPEWVENVIFLEDEPNYIDLYILSFCKHNIITNSSFGWWGAYLNQNPDKIVVYPQYWIRGFDTRELCPSNWIPVYASHT